MQTQEIDRRLQRLQEQEIIEQAIIDDDISRPGRKRDAQVKLLTIVDEIKAIRESQKIILASKEDPDLYKNTREDSNIIRTFSV